MILIILNIIFILALVYIIFRKISYIELLECKASILKSHIEGEIELCNYFQDRQKEFALLLNFSNKVKLKDPVLWQKINDEFKE
jgi:hypothetical protein